MSKKKKDKPDMVVDKPHAMEYPTNLGAPSFAPEKMDLYLANVSNELSDIFKQEFNELKSRYIDLMDEVKWNNMVYSAEMKFKPVIGKIYYLYSREKEYFLSMLSPEEWGRKYNFELVGKFKLMSNHKWQKL